MPKNKKEAYLLALNQNELIELLQSLILKQELDTRTASRKGEPAAENTMNNLLENVNRRFGSRTAEKLKDEILDLFDTYIDKQVDDEVMWQQIENELKRTIGE